MSGGFSCVLRGVSDSKRAIVRHSLMSALQTCDYPPLAEGRAVLEGFAGMDFFLVILWRQIEHFEMSGGF